MVTTVSPVSSAAQGDSARSGTSVDVFGAASREVSASSYPSRVQARPQTVQGEYPSAPPEVVFARSSTVTSPEVFKDL